MNQKIRTFRLLALLLPLGLAACATPPIDCSRDRDASRTAGQTGEWLASTIDAVDPNCRAAATEAWLSAAGALDCSTRFAFSAARLGHAINPDCAAAAYVGAARLGAMIGELERERASIEIQLADENLAADTRRDLRQRSITIDRDLPQLEGLARFDDLLPPAAVPNAPN